MRSFVVLSLTAVACASQPVQGLVPPAAPAPSAVHVPPAESPLPAQSGAPDAPPTAGSASAPPVVVAAAQSSVALEAPYRTGHFGWPDDPKARRALLKEQETWNLGGLADGQTWHPAPRVVIGEPVVVKGKADTRELMRVLRAEHYWTVRRCYDPALRDHPKLDGRAVVELTLDKTGRVRTASAKKAKVPDTRVHKTAMSDKEVVRCWVHGLTGADLPSPRTKTATVAFSIDVWPGDAPLPETNASAKPGKIDLTGVAKTVETRLSDLTACGAEGRKEKPGAWGRLALRVDVGEDGSVGEVSETESTFPVASVVACATRILRELSWPKPRDGAARVTIPLRFAPGT